MDTRRRWIGLGVLVTALSMIVLDGTIVAVALPTIVRSLRLTLTDAQWVNSVYSVVFAALLLAAGWLGDRVGRRTTLVGGVAIFLLGSLLAARSGSATGLISARVVQGVGGAFVLPSTLSTVNATFRGRDRAAAFGVWGAVISGAAAVGPLLGGWLTQSFSWEWIFYINIPIGVLVLIGAVLFVDNTRHGQDRPGVDVDGFQLSALGFGLLVFGIIEGATLGWWRPLAPLHVAGLTWGTNAPVSAAPVAVALGLACIGLFVRWERHRTRVRRSQLLDLDLFRYPSFVWGNLTAGAVAIGEFALVFVIPLYLVDVLRMSTLGSGWVLSAMAGGAFLAGAQARHLAARFGPARVVLIGLGLELAGVLLLTTMISATATVWVLAILLAVYGVGLGLASAQLTSTVLADIPTAVSGQGSATQSTIRQVGAALGAAVAGAVLSAGIGNTLTHTTPTTFAHATRWAILSAAAFLLLGLIGALQVNRHTRYTPAPEATHE